MEKEPRSFPARRIRVASSRGDGEAVASRILVLTMCVGAVWGVSGFALLTQSEFLLYRLAVIPRDFGSLPGIVGMPFVHGSWLHLISNTMPLLILGGMVMFRGVRYFGAVTFMIMLLGGLLLWCFGRSNAHIGASGLAFGYLGFLVTRGFYERSWQSIGVAALVVFLYGGMIFGVVPRNDGVSWEAHLFGLLAGIAVARGAFGLERKRRQALADEDTLGVEPARTPIDLRRRP